MTDHTPEPLPIAEEIPGGFVVTPQTWARAVACMRVCAGIPTKQLGDVKALVDALDCLLGYHKKAQAQTQLGRGSQQAVSKAEVALASFRED